MADERAVRAADGALLYHPAVGKAHRCVGYGVHIPEPARYVWHHLMPESLGGASDATNLISLCDVCHYNVHELLYMLRQSGGNPDVWRIGGGRMKYGARVTRGFAWQGWLLCLAAGVQDRIPNEGGTWAA